MTRHLILLTMSFALAFSGLTFDARAEKKGGMKGMSFENIDTDKNGRITQTELNTFLTRKADRIFQQADADNDGSITRNEMEEAHKGWMGKHHRMKGDKNMKHGDGPGWSFEDFDKNQDGQINRAEFEGTRDIKMKKMSKEKQSQR